MTVIMLCAVHGLFYKPDKKCAECSNELDASATADRPPSAVNPNGDP
jgi:uncharacterized protein (DUF983 family)